MFYNSPMLEKERVRRYARGASVRERNWQAHYSPSIDKLYDLVDLYRDNYSTDTSFYDQITAGIADALKLSTGPLETKRNIIKVQRLVKFKLKQREEDSMRWTTDFRHL